MTDSISDYRVQARCCRDWELTPFARIGRCGYCGEVPEVVAGSFYKVDGDD